MVDKSVDEILKELKAKDAELKAKKAELEAKEAELTNKDKEIKNKDKEVSDVKSAIKKLLPHQLARQKLVNEKKPWNSPLPEADPEFVKVKGFDMVKCEKCGFSLNKKAIAPNVLSARMARHKKAKQH